MRGWAAGLLLLALALPARAALLAWTADEREAIAAHGPWPPPAVHDASNRVDGRPEAVALGRRLFFDRRLSAGGRLSCAGCHAPDRAFQDGRRFARHGRNTPGLLDVAQRRWFGWDGAHDNLWSASLAPLVAADEIGATAESLAQRLRAGPAGREYRALFGAPAAEQALLVNVAKALAAYQATLVSPRTVFDDFRDALLRGDEARAARYPEAAQRGLRLFISRGRCTLCHAGPAFTNGEFADIGRPFFRDGGVDPGRWGGLERLLASPTNRLGEWSDGDAGSVPTRHVVLEPRHFGEFRVPGLRQLGRTAPYLHDGSAPTLDAVLRHYSELDPERLHTDGVAVLQPLRLSARETADLKAFLESLSAPAAGPVRRAASRP